jgi:hypothetical protein
VAEKVEKGGREARWILKERESESKNGYGRDRKFDGRKVSKADLPRVERLTGQERQSGRGM